ncbi:MAG TPA: hypothetical protein VE645_05420 [Pseudonocardiaceae bacterium]|nr:hypothetical protein [Pseudonocardiaceae bacterium]
MRPSIEKLLLVGCAEPEGEAMARPAWSDTQKVIGMADLSGGHRVDGR